MPTPSRFSSRVEFCERSLTRRTSSPTLKSPSIHSGLLYADGTVHSGGRSHINVPRDHQVIAPKREVNEVVYEPSCSTATGKYVTLGKRLYSPIREPASPLMQRTVTGRKHITPAESESLLRESPVRDNYRRQKNNASTPRDSFISGLAESRAADPAEKPRGVRHLEGPPRFEPPSFDKRPYSPQLKRVLSKPVDNDVFLTGRTASSPARVQQQSPARVLQQSPARAATPTRHRGVAPGQAAYNIVTNQSN